MFTRVLIANRGEIAVRVIRALREMGIESVAVYSTADRDALHVRLADHAYEIGPPPSSESYLLAQKLVDVARRAGCQAIHPGYGFLAENAEFAERVEAAGLAFVGPPPAAIRAMGEKTRARELASAAGVPVVPGSPGDVADAAEAARIAATLGYPVLLKAVGGGGGKGMRLVSEPSELETALRLTRNEAQAAFGAPAIYLEKYLPAPRHIEVQILADRHGNTIHLGERECSVQRRHQKLVEESPSPFITPEERASIGRAAVAAARAAGYVSAGTVEFMFAQDRRFYFLEMNTRLQVEHPVTEMVTRTDLVKEQLRIAAGEKLAIRQEDVRPEGAAIECRLCAEDPHLNFLPTAGRIRRLDVPGGPGVRLDSGIYEGYEVPIHYDSLFAKLIVWGATREEALDRMERALGEFRVEGIKTNVPLHRWLMRQPAFRAGRLSTEFLAEHFDPKHLGDAGVLEMPAVVAAAIAAYEAGRVPRAMDDMARMAGTGVGAARQAALSAWKMAGRYQLLGGRRHDGRHTGR